MPSPFQVGRPVHGEEFFGRLENLEEVLQLLERGSAVNIFSLRRIGKTSMRNQIAYLCAHEPRWQRFRPVSVDLQIFAGQHDLGKLASYVAHQLRIEIGPADGLDAWLAIRDRLLDVTGETILLVDEAEIFGDVTDVASLAALRALQQERAIGLVIFTGYYSLAEILESSQSTRMVGSLLWNIFFPLRLPAFSLDEAETLLTTQFSRAGYVMTPVLAQRLAAYVGGYPQIVQEVGHAAYEYCFEGGIIEANESHLGAVTERWRRRIAPWWPQMFLRAFEIGGPVETLRAYGLVDTGASAQLEVAPFIRDLVAHDRSGALESAIQEALKRSVDRPSASSQDNAPVPRELEVFFSYSHKDEALRDELASHLKVLERKKVIRGWHDRRVGAGEEWRRVIDDSLQRADIVLLLVSSDFLASDYCYDVEMRCALTRHDAGDAVVLPIILRECKWDGAPFAKLQALPKGGKAVTSWTNRDEAWANVAAGVETVVARVRRS